MVLLSLGEKLNSQGFHLPIPNTKLSGRWLNLHYMCFIESSKNHFHPDSWAFSLWSPVLPQLLGIVILASFNSLYLNCWLFECLGFFCVFFVISDVKSKHSIGTLPRRKKFKVRGPPEALTSVLEMRVEVELLATSIFSLKCSCPESTFQTILATAGALSHLGVFKSSIKNNFEILIETENRKEPNCPLLITATRRIKEKYCHYETKTSTAGIFREHLAVAAKQFFQWSVDMVWQGVLKLKFPVFVGVSPHLQIVFINIRRWGCLCHLDAQNICGTRRVEKLSSKAKSLQVIKEYSTASVKANAAFWIQPCFQLIKDIHSHYSIQVLALPSDLETATSNHQI